ncbi:unnamed protein product [Clavelina lepadiformis]|uniref:Single-strand selective monofunctional uracil DNA glycosylase n=1 Tax=Clavelina lepadiformis TaxID=159417 RepID=A0ABP0EW83_CLALP
MDGYFNGAIEKQAIQQHLGPGFNFSSFSNISQTTSTVDQAYSKQTEAGIPQDYFNDEPRWKDNKQGSSMAFASAYNLYNNNLPGTLIATQQQAATSELDVLPATQLPNQLFSASVQVNRLMQQNMSTDNTSSSFTSQEQQILSQHQELDSQQEQVILGNDIEEENFNSQLVLAFLWIEAKLCAQLKCLKFCERVTSIYNPLEYASDPHAHYVSKYCGTKTVLFLGMNPGPFGMAQNGVPFGDTRYVREWLKISGQVHPPANENSKRPIYGLNCSKSEVSGARFWGFIAKTSGSPEIFFQNCFVHNYCPLVFMTKTGTKITNIIDSMKVARWELFHV